MGLEPGPAGWSQSPGAGARAWRLEVETRAQGLGPGAVARALGSGARAQWLKPGLGGWSQGLGLEPDPRGWSQGLGAGARAQGLGPEGWGGVKKQRNKAQKVNFYENECSIKCYSSLLM